MDYICFFIPLYSVIPYLIRDPSVILRSEAFGIGLISKCLSQMRLRRRISLLTHDSFTSHARIRTVFSPIVPCTLSFVPSPYTGYTGYTGYPLVPCTLYYFSLLPFPSNSRESHCTLYIVLCTVLLPVLIASALGGSQLSMQNYVRLHYLFSFLFVGGFRLRRTSSVIDGRSLDTAR